ncbi:hypothetical protein TA3x_004260 [Tundrisphaera sp. TA3]|uniref:hypothetical protein n=1 Tax=Tundrisphaera sp. TA3 TaxID=3435775 RepID=UPI003EC04AC9
MPLYNFMGLRNLFRKKNTSVEIKDQISGDRLALATARAGGVGAIVLAVLEGLQPHLGEFLDSRWVGIASAAVTLLVLILRDLQRGADVVQEPLEKHPEKVAILAIPTLPPDKSQVGITETTQPEDRYRTFDIIEKEHIDRLF